MDKVKASEMGQIPWTLHVEETQRWYSKGYTEGIDFICEKLENIIRGGKTDIIGLLHTLRNMKEHS